MRLLLINDLHIAKPGEFTHGVNVRENFINILEKIRGIPADLLVINGDLCFSVGEQEIYNWIKEQLSSLPFDVAVTSGNHDDPVLLAAAFGKQAHLREEEFYYYEKFQDQHLIFLDTTKGTISRQQLTWLEEQLNTIPFEAFIFMHHPPVKVGVPYMDDQHSLRNMSDVQEVLLNFSGNAYVFSGHYHVEKVVQLENITLMVTPSCFFQINQFEEKFAVDHYDIAFRDIVWQDGQLRTAVHYQPGTKMAQKTAASQ